MTNPQPLVHLPPWPANHDQLAAKLINNAVMFEDEEGDNFSPGAAKLMREAAKAIRALVANYDHTVKKAGEENADLRAQIEELRRQQERA